MTQPIRSSLMWTTLAAALACAAGCMTEDLATDDETGEAADDGDETVSETEQSIHAGGVAASTFQFQRAALLTNLGTRATRRCTATVIGPSHVLTTARCNPQVGERILFYTSAQVNESSDRFIDSVRYPPGVSPTSGDFFDTDNKYANLAIVHLSSPVPSTSRQATLAWTYNGANRQGTKVGAGDHQTPSTKGMLRQIADVTYSSSDSGGNFWTAGQQTNTADEGGPFYYGSRVLGVLDGYIWEWVYRDQYSSVPESLGWIVQNMGFSWGRFVHTFREVGSGTIYQQLYVENQTTCQYACQNTSVCAGYSYDRLTKYCKIYSQIDSVVDSGFGDMSYKY